MGKESLHEHMTYESLTQYRELNAAWRLLASDNAAFVTSFLYQEFIAENKREIPEYILLSHLESYIEDIPSISENKKSASEYLKEWGDDGHGWLRRYHILDNDETHYDLTSSAQKAIEWLVGLKEKSFVGTESRLILVFELLNQITEQTQLDPERRIEELERQKAEIELEIERAKQGDIKVLEPVQVKERFLQAMSMSREISSDFRLVEQNFRELNRNMREKIVTWDKSKGELIENYFENKNIIQNSEQGRSFYAFFEFLTSKVDRDNFKNSVEYLRGLEEIKEDVYNSGIERMPDDWLMGSERVLRTIEVMSEQLRRYVDENYVQDERRINELIKSIEANAGLLKGELPKGDFISIDMDYADINLIFNRELFKPSEKIVIQDNLLDYGEEEESYEDLYNSSNIDKTALISNVNEILKQKPKVTLTEVVEDYPLKYGLEELLAYLDLGQDNIECIINDSTNEVATWKNADNEEVLAEIPLVEFFIKE